MQHSSPSPRADAHARLAARYGALIDALLARGAYDQLGNDTRLSLVNLSWMCRELTRAAATMPIDKAARWLGFIQGCLAMRGLIDVDAERDITRPIFHAAYTAEGLPDQATRARDT